MLKCVLKSNSIISGLSLPHYNLSPTLFTLPMKKFSQEGRVESSPCLNDRILQMKIHPSTENKNTENKQTQKLNFESQERELNGVEF